MDNPKSVGEPDAGSTVERSKKRNQDHAEGSGSKKSEGINVFDRPLKKCKTKKRIQKSKNKIDEDDKFRDQKNELIIEMSRSIKELTEAVKSLPETLLTILKDRKTTPEINEEKERHPRCHLKSRQHIRKNPCVDCQDVGRHNERTILVLRLDELHLPRDQVKIMLRALFGSCGEIKTLSVPIDYKTGFPVGFAFINLMNGQGYDKALKLHHYELEGVQLDVTLAENLYVSEMYHGCERCMSDTFALRKPGFDLDQDHPALDQDPDPQAPPTLRSHPYRVYC